MKRLATAGQVISTTPVRKNTDGMWVVASAIKGLIENQSQVEQTTDTQAVVASSKGERIRSSRRNKTPRSGVSPFLLVGSGAFGTLAIVAIVLFVFKWPDLARNTGSNGDTKSHAVLPARNESTPIDKNQVPDKGHQKNEVANKATLNPSSGIESTGVPLAKEVQPSENELAATLRKYLSAASWKDRLPYVRSPEQVKDSMAEMYAKSRGFQNTSIEIDGPDSKEIESARWATLPAKWKDSTPGRTSSTEYILVRTRDGWKVDWEASTGYNRVKLPIFVAKRDNAPVVFRVKCKLDNYHNYEYSETKSSHYSIAVNADGKRIHGYIPRESPIGKRLSAILEDGQEHNLALELQHVGPRGESTRNSDSSGEVVSITRLVSESWVLED